MRTLLALVTLLLASCASQPITVQTDYDARYDFTPIQTWAWLAPIRTVTPEEPEDYRLASEWIRRSIEAEMAAKGYRLLDDPASADVNLTAHAQVERQSRTEVFHDEYVYDTYGYQYRGFSSTLGHTESATTWYSEGTLFVDIVRPSDKENVWTGSASAVLERGGTLEEREQRIRRAVVKLLAEFPPDV